jgi:hypothetical protein
MLACFIGLLITALVFKGLWTFISCYESVMAEMRQIEGDDDVIFK